MSLYSCLYVCVWIGPPQPLLLAEEWTLLHPAMELLLTDSLGPVSQPQADPPSLGQHLPPPCPLLEVQQKPLEPQTHEPKVESSAQYSLG